MPNIIKNKRNFIIGVLLSICTIFVIISVSSLNNLFKLKADVNDISGAVFDIGANVNVKMKQLSGQVGVTTQTQNTTITSIQRSNTLSITPTDDNIVSASTSEVPIYMWYDNGIIYWYSEESKLKLNPDSSAMFSNLQGLINLDLSSFDTSEVTNMGGMFGYTKFATLNLTNFNTSNVESMRGMFYGCSNLTSLDLSNFDTSKVTDMVCMFYGCSSLTNLNLSNFNTKNVTNMYKMFGGCSSLTSLDLSNFDTSKVTDMSFMFYECYNLNNIDISSFDTSKVTSMTAMFGLTKFATLNLTNFNTSNVTTMSDMFYGCGNLTSLNISDFDTSKVTDMSYMFYFCTKLTDLDLSKFNTNKVTTMIRMFEGCDSLVSLNLSGFNTSQVTDMSYMFHWCRSLTNLDLSSFDTRNVTNMSEMFCDCSNLTTIYASKKFVVNQLESSNNIFCNNTKLIGGQGTIYDSTKVDNTYARLDWGSVLPGYFSTVYDSSKLNIKESEYLILNRNSTLKTITDLLERTSNVKVLRNNSELNNTTKLKTTDILEISNDEYDIVVLGDNNNDGKIDISDISKMYRIYSRRITPNKLEKYSSDMTEDGKIDISDLSKIYRIYTGRIE